MDKNITLSICIPTYNRPIELVRLLNSIYSQLNEQVEIVIGDDGDFAVTQNVLRAFSQANVVHFSNAKESGLNKNGNATASRISFDNNLCAVTNKASGKYVWWCGDDDIITPGAISKVLELINKNPEINYIWANYKINGTDRLAIDFPTDRFFSDSNELLKIATTGLGFMSATIFKKSQASSGMNSVKKYIGSGFSNLYLVLCVISQGGPCYYFRGPLVICYTPTQAEIKESVTKKGVESNDFFQLFGVTISNIFHEFDGKFDRSTIRAVIKNSFASLWRGMLVAWVDDWEEPRSKLWTMFKYYWSFPEFWIAAPLFLAPLWVNKVLFRIYKIFFSHRKWAFMRKVK